MKITVIDGQGGKMGACIIKELKARKVNAEIFGIGTNGIATSMMMKMGADYGATGLNPVVVACRDSDIIVGPIGIVIADSLFGEVTPEMAVAVGQSNAHKVLLPVSKCKIHTVCNTEKSVTDIVNDSVDIILRLVKQINN